MSHELTKLMVAVDTFAAMMKRKLVKKADTGASGWNNPDCRDRVKTALRIATEKLLDGDRSQGCDVANLAMFLVLTPENDDEKLA